jgi:hypothetical protein
VKQSGQCWWTARRRKLFSKTLGKINSFQVDSEKKEYSVFSE